MSKGNISKIKFCGSAAAELDFYEDGKLKIRISSLSDREDKYKLRFSNFDYFVIGTGLGYSEKSIYILDKKTSNYLYLSKIDQEKGITNEEIEAIKAELE